MMNILAALNDNFIEPMSVMLYSLCKAHPNELLDIYLLYHDLSENNIKKLNQVLELFEDKNLKPIDVGEEIQAKISGKGNLTIETWYRLYGLKLLPKEMERILWIDGDMIVKGKLNEMYDMNIEKYSFAVCEDIHAIVNGIDGKLKNQCGVPKEEKYFNAGIMLINLSYLRKKNLIDTMMYVVYNEYDRYQFLDQDILNRMFYGTVKYIPWSLYNLPPIFLRVDVNELANNNIHYATYYDINHPCDDFHERYIDVTKQVQKNAVIIHYLADSKPWKHRNEEMYWVYSMYKDYWFDYEKELNELLQ